MPPTITVIANSRSGKGADDSLRSKLEELFRANGRDAEIRLAGENDLKSLAEKAAQGPADLVVAAGGDGTVACVAAALVGTDKTLGVLPLGTLNHFSKDLHLPQELEEAVRVVIVGQTIHVDVAEVNDRVFLNTSSLGLYPLVISERDAEQRRFGRGKWSAFARAFFHVLRRHPLMQVSIVADGRKISRRTPSVFVGNNEYELKGFDLGTRNSLQDGKLGLYVTRDTSRWGVFRLLARALFGRLDPSVDYDGLALEEAWVETRHGSALVATDGEVTTMTSPLHYRIRPAALRVRVPREEEPD
ncbi:MAG: sphingosine kinase [Verrucomicrobia bacterium]|nr:sphingosine kinase [Verrucomicrobiota bacterium]